jgi:xylono-1,5-lactonase
VCSGRDIVHVRGDTTRTMLHIDGVAGWNDLCTDSAGRVYAGALRFAVFDPDAEAVPGELWSIDPDDGPTVVFGDVIHANGVSLSPDQQTIYMSDSRAQRIIVYDMARATRRDIDVSAYGHPDGMAIDENGALWVALVSGGIGRFTPDGELDSRIEAPSAFVTSVCFKGRDLYVTTGSHRDQRDLRGCVLAAPVDVAGAPVAPARV